MAKKKSSSGKKHDLVKDALRGYTVTKRNGYDLFKDNKTGKTVKVPWDID